MNTLNEVLELNGVEVTDELVESIQKHYDCITQQTTLECGDDDYLIVTVELSHNMPAHVMEKYLKTVRDSMVNATGRKVMVLPSSVSLSVLKVA